VINYVIAAWGGERREDYAPEVPYIKQHVDKLIEFNPDAQITIVVPENDDPPEFSAAIDEAESLGAVILRRENRGLSYGSWNHAWQQYKNAGFDWWIFIEDDYVPAFRSFEYEMIRLYRRYIGENGGYLCGLVLGGADGYGKGTARAKRHVRHASNSNGITEQRCLERIQKRYGELPHSKAADYTQEGGQIAFSHRFLRMKMDLLDVGVEYRTLVWQNGRIRVFFANNKTALFLPLQVNGSPEWDYENWIRRREKSIT
jgi:hypothetical protein